MRIVAVGDTHGNVDWWSRVVAPAVLDERADLVIQVGDFGWWPHAGVFVDVVRASPVPVWFVDGNHEHWPSLTAAVAQAGPSSDGTVPLGGNLAYVPRGSVIEVSGWRALFCGGAHSIDRELRRPGLDWWPEEDVTDDDVARCAAHGPVDIVVSHDAPDRWPIPGIDDRQAMPAAWRRELPACHAGHRQLTRILDGAQPRLAVHGHFHVGYTTTVPGDGDGDDDRPDLEVVGLAADGMTRSVATLELSGSAATGSVRWDWCA